MRRLSIFGVFLSILIAGCALIPAQAAEVNPRPIEDYEAAIQRIDDFVSYAQTYAPISQYQREYDYLESLALITSNLVDHYADGDTDYMARHAEDYNIAITAIDQAIDSCRYIFGIVRAESLAAQAAQANTTPAPGSAPIATAKASNTQPTTSQTTTTPATLAVATTDTKSESNNQSTDNAAITTFQATKSQDDAADTELPVEIPNTGGISQSSSILFIVIMSFVAAIAATGIHFAYNHQSKPATPAARRKRR